MPLQTNQISESGARWLKCDLHVHTPFDGEKRFGENIRQAIKDFKNQDSERLTQIARNFLNACRNAADGSGLDIVALTDHNSIDGYKYLKPEFDALNKQAKNKGSQMPVILPGVEFSVGGERPIHFLSIFSSDASVDDIQGVINHVFGTRKPFNPGNGTPQATGESVGEFIDRLHEYCHPSGEERNLQFVLLPAHAEGNRGVEKETSVRSPIGGAMMDEMKGHLRQQVVTRREWHGFETAKSFDELSENFRNLLVRWEAARRGDDWGKLSKDQKKRYQDQKHWPLIECSDPHRYEAIGTRFSWLKMEVPDVEGIRLALLDPQSRLRRMKDGPPTHAYTHLKRITVKGTDFFEDIEIPLSPCLTTLIGGRGSGKSTIIEYLRYATDRNRSEYLPDKSDSVAKDMQSILSPKDKRDFGREAGTLLPDHQILIEVIIAEKLYQVCRSLSGIKIMRNPDQEDSHTEQLDVHSLVLPRILSQRQIAEIARDPASQRRELDALIDNETLRRIEDDQTRLIDKLVEYQALRNRLNESKSKTSTIVTELQKVNDQISFFEKDSNEEVLTRFGELEQERTWLENALEEVKQMMDKLARSAEDIGEFGLESDELQALESENTWLRSVADRILKAQGKTINILQSQFQNLKSLCEIILSEQPKEWQPIYDQVSLKYNELVSEMKDVGVEITEHEKLLQRRMHLERENSSLQRVDQDLEQIQKKIVSVQLELIGIHKERLKARKTKAEELEEMDADVRLDIIAFGDRNDFEERREQWFGGAGLQERDWKVICDYIFETDDGIPCRIHKLLRALRIDINTSRDHGRVIKESNSKIVSLVGKNNLTRHFFNALLKRESIRIDEMDCFLPDDLIRTQVRARDGSFKTIETGSIGEKSTAVLSLLLSAGEQPIVIDQPEDDLDNQYVYDVVVDLVRHRKFKRQIIIATHNANIPVNGDAELIIVMGVENQMGKVLGKGSIDQPKIKRFVTDIMEGSAEAFRLRRERYGY